MSSLKEMIKFLVTTKKDLENIVEKLDKIQLNFNDNFSNVNRIRNSEIEFLQDEFFKSADKFPDKIKKFYEKELVKQEKAFLDNFKKLKEKEKEINNEMEKAETERLNFFKTIKRNNTKLDNKEEKLKKDIEDYENNIKEYNSEIDEMDNGFGFVINFLKMRKIQERKEKLINKRDTFIEDIETVREKWEKAIVKYSELEKQVLENWNTVKTDQSIIVEKVKNLENNKKEIIRKAAFIAALNMLEGDEDFLKSQNEAAFSGKCPRCESENKENRFFCFYCGERFKKDRKDLDGSLIEIGELNVVHGRLLKGIRKSVSFLALIKGIKKGVTEFIKSVESVKTSQDKFSSLPKLKIDVPEFSRGLASKMSELESKTEVNFYNVHPVRFNDSFSEYEEYIFTDKNIEDFFGKMGDELNSTTKKQWG